MTHETISGKKPTVIAYPFADGGDKNVISSTTASTDVVNLQYGFPSAFSKPRSDSGKSVSRKDMNGILNAMSSLNYYYQYMGVNPWVSGMSGGYPTGAVVLYSGAVYVSNSDDNTYTPGGSDVTTWTKLWDYNGLATDAELTSRVATLEGLLDELAVKFESLDYRVTQLEGGTPTPAVNVSMLKNMSYLYAGIDNDGGWCGAGNDVSQKSILLDPLGTKTIQSPYEYFGSSTRNVGWAIVFKYTGFLSAEVRYSDLYRHETRPRVCEWVSKFTSGELISSSSGHPIMGIGGTLTIPDSTTINNYTYTKFINYPDMRFNGANYGKTIQYPFADAPSDTTQYHTIGCAYSSGSYKYMTASSDSLPTTYSGWTTSSTVLPSGATDTGLTLWGGSPIGICKIAYFNFNTDETVEFTPKVYSGTSTKTWMFVHDTTTLASGTLGYIFYGYEQ